MLKRKFTLSLFALFVFSLVGWTIYAYEDHTAHDLQLLHALADDYLSEPTTIALIHRNSYAALNGKQQLNDEGQKLCRQFQLDDCGLRQNGAAKWIFSGVASLADQIHLQMHLFETDAGSSYLTIQVEADGNTPLPLLTDQLEKVTLQLHKLGQNPNWNVMLQGYIRATADTDHTQIGERLQHALSAEIIERYEDVNTVSMTYYAPKLRAVPINGAHPMNLQVAFHRDTDNNKWRCTIGTPLITMEY